MTPQEKAAALVADEELCDHCLGRQFARLGHGLENWERGMLVRAFLDRGEELSEESFDREHIPDGEPEREECSICEGLFQDVDKYLKRIMNALERYDFDTFLIGTRPPNEVVQAEEELWEVYGLDWVSPIKSEVNRLIGKQVEDATDAVVDFERPDVNAVMDIPRDHVEVQVNSLLLEGRYNKYARDLPQTRWPCGECRGSGCDACNWTGKQYMESVQELIEEPVLRETKGLETKFHGAGREDVDAKCLGGRRFVIEVMEPQDRDIDPAALQAEVNEAYGEKIEVFDLQFTEKDRVEAVKSLRADKSYRATITLSEPVDDAMLENLSDLVGTVTQETPSRVEHRRAQKTRTREVFDASWERVDETTITLDVTAAAGTYIKELISGDGEKTSPSVSGLLGVEAECTALDVTGFSYGESGDGEDS